MEVQKFVWTHDFSRIPNPAASVEFGLDESSNACNECLVGESAERAVEWMEESWWGR